MVTKEIEYEHTGTKLCGFLVYPEDNRPRPAVMIAHAWAGRDQFVCDKAVELAKLGYTAFALDVYGKGVLGQSTEEKAKLMTPFMEDRTLLAGRLLSAYNLVATLPQTNTNKIAIIGYCFGGLCALDLVREGVNLQGAVSFHGLLQPRQAKTVNPHTRVLALHGAADPMVSLNDVEKFSTEMDALGIGWQMHIYGGAKHAFTNPQANDHALGTVYNAQADKHSNHLLQNFLQEIFH